MRGVPAFLHPLSRNGKSFSLDSPEKGPTCKPGVGAENKEQNGDLAAAGHKQGFSETSSPGVTSRKKRPPLLDRRQTWEGGLHARDQDSPSPRSPGSSSSLQSFDLPAHEDLAALQVALPDTLPRIGSSDDSSASMGSGSRPGTPTDSGRYYRSLSSPRGGMHPLARMSSNGGGNIEFNDSGAMSEVGVVLRRRMSGESAQLSSCSADVVGSGPHASRVQEEEVDVVPLVDILRSGTEEEQRAAAAMLRGLAKHSMANRTKIAAAGGIAALVDLMLSTNPDVVEQAVTALLNVSINEGTKGPIAASGAVPRLVDVLQTGSPVARENAAATLFSLSTIDENKIAIGQSGAIPPLVDLLINGSDRGKKDACTALFNLSVYIHNRPKIVKAGAVKELVRQLENFMVDKACAVLANLAALAEARDAIVAEGGLSTLVDLLETGSSKGKENAAAALVHLSLNNPDHSALVVREGATPALVALSQAGTVRAREKANQLLKHFREQRRLESVKHGDFHNRSQTKALHACTYK